MAGRIRLERHSRKTMAEIVPGATIHENKEIDSKKHTHVANEIKGTLKEKHCACSQALRPHVLVPENARSEAR
jgi:hypothetical protein